MLFAQPLQHPERDSLRLLPLLWIKRSIVKSFRVQLSGRLLEFLCDKVHSPERIRFPLAGPLAIDLYAVTEFIGASHALYDAVLTFWDLAKGRWVQAHAFQEPGHANGASERPVQNSGRTRLAAI